MIQKRINELIIFSLFHFVFTIVVFIMGLMILRRLDVIIERKTKDTQEYQIRLELDSAYIYDGSRLVGVTPHGNDGIDSVLLYIHKWSITQDGIDVLALMEKDPFISTN